MKRLSRVITRLRCYVVDDWLKNPTPFFNQRGAKPKPIAFFYRFELVKSNCYEFWLAHRAVCSCCDWSYYFGSCFSTGTEIAPLQALRDHKNRRLERLLFVSATDIGPTLETSALLYSLGGNLTLIHSFDARFTCKNLLQIYLQAPRTRLHCKTQPPPLHQRQHKERVHLKQQPKLNCSNQQMGELQQFQGLWERKLNWQPRPDKTAPKRGELQKSLESLLGSQPL